MPSRKQRRRRDKSFRHEYETVLLDDEGNEKPIAEIREQQRAEKKPAKTQAKPTSRAQREPPQPTWRRAFRRGGLMGGAIFVAFVFVLHGGSTASRASIAVIYAVAFIPLTYWVDRLAYRSYLKRTAKLDAKS
ncbi:MAG TPA: hypothetical protein VGU02_05185 [Gaiellaceae bacterium]|nr:hypothetical protein [Gaiellaceae bacterium]